MSTLFDLIKESIGSNNFERVKLIAIKAHEQKMADIAEIYAEKGMELNGNDKEILYIRAKYAIKKKNYALAFDCLKTYKEYYTMDNEKLHDYFKCMEQCEHQLDDEDVEFIKRLYEEDSLNASERYLLLNYNKEKNDTSLWEIYFESKSNSGKTDDRNAYKNARIYADERWEIYLTFRKEYSIEHHAWLSHVVVKSLMDDASNEVVVADNADAAMLVSKLKIKNVKDTLYKTDKGTVVCLEQKIRVRELNPESEEKNALS